MCLGAGCVVCVARLVCADLVRLLLGVCWLKWIDCGVALLRLYIGLGIVCAMECCVLCVLLVSVCYCGNVY